jgi:hypothetical protein
MVGTAVALLAGLTVLGPSCSEEDDPSTPMVNGGSPGAGGSVGMGGTVAPGMGGMAAGAGGTAGVGAGGAAGMGTGGTPAGGAGGSAPTMTVNVEPVIMANTTWTADKVYVLGAGVKTFVKGDATLTIEAGTTICGNDNSALVITRGAKINATGTADKPIVFTSCKAEGMKAPGDWGGLVILGKAPINTEKLSMPPKDETVFEAIPGGTDGLFGGTDPADNSGVLKYVRFEFGGSAFMPGKEWNNLTLCGVGSGTTVDHIQSHRGQDDGIEFFGGTVNAKYLLLTQNEDDGLDTDNGYSGKIQYLIIQHNTPKGTDASNGYESDNHALAASYDNTPRTGPTISNVTMIGKPDYALDSWGARLRRGTSGKYWNHIIWGFKGGVALVENGLTKTQADMGNLFFKHSIFFATGPVEGVWSSPKADPDPDSMMMDKFDEKANFNKPENMLRLVDPMLEDPNSLAAPNFKPKAGSPALTGGMAPPGDAFFEAAAYVGAIGADDWTKPWAAYPQPRP